MNQVARRTCAGLAVGAGVVALFVYLPLRALMPAVLVLALLAQFEFYQLARRYAPVAWLGLAAGAAWIAAAGLFGFGRGLLALAAGFPLLLLALFALACLAVLFSPARERPLASIAATLFGFLYAPLLMSFFLLVAQLPGDGFWGSAPTVEWSRAGLYTLFALVATAKFSDTGGFALGLAFGRHKMCPSVSPKKSWEGLAGSMVFAAATMCVFLALARRFGWDAHIRAWRCLGYPGAAALGAATAVAATLGDLVESRLKREAGVKDSATFMPAGMGGFLDMFDSVLFLPALFYPVLLYFQM